MAFCDHCSSEKGGVIWLGEHHNSRQDHKLQAQIIRSIYETRKKNSVLHERSDGARTPPSSSSATSPPMSIGLEQVQVQFQPVLDMYVQGSISEELMLFYVQWERRWNWSFENYRPVFELARELKIPLIALNVNSEDFAAVQEYGFQGLSKKQIQQYIKDP